MLLLACAGIATATVPLGFRHWTADQIREINQKLPLKMDALKDATETIGSFGNHSIVLAHREASGRVEIHETKVDIMFIESGEAMIAIGGKVPDAKITEPNEMRGSKIDGGERQTVHAGDILHIPAKTPHQFLLAPGQKIDYYTVKIVAP
jgi:mannose-6-phosphate isomerase-like protein (cupin superfamily)